MSCRQACEGCAFTPGAVANLEPNNALRGLLCVLGPSPFYCHHNLEWWKAHPATYTMDEVRQLIKDGYQVCGGWQREVAALAKTGYYKDNPIITQACGRMGLDALEIFLSKEVDTEYKNAACRTLGRMVKLLGRKRRKFEAKAKTKTRPRRRRKELNDE